MERHWANVKGDLDPAPTLIESTNGKAFMYITIIDDVKIVGFTAEFKDFTFKLAATLFFL